MQSGIKEQFVGLRRSQQKWGETELFGLGQSYLCSPPAWLGQWPAAPAKHFVILLSLHTSHPTSLHLSASPICCFLT